MNPFRFPLLPVFFAVSAVTLSAQTLYLPDASGTSIVAGKVGIGTNTPDAKLQIVGDLYVSSPSGSQLIRAFGPTAGFQFTDEGSYVYLRPYHAALGDKPLQIGPGPGGIRIDASGNVGIGATSPDTKLDVAGTIRAYTDAFGGKITFGNGNATDVLASQAADGSASLSFNLWNGSTNATVLFAKGSGNVGIGTSTPAEKLEVAGGQILVSGTVNPYIILKSSASGQPYGFLQYDQNEGNFMRIYDGSQYSMVWKAGNVGIGTTNPTQKLSVNGTIQAKEVIVQTGWSDYVFATDYQLPALSAVEAHIKAEKHLPGIPSAQEVAANGISVGEMQAKLLAKIEELTLHQIEQEKTQANLSAKLAAQSSQLSAQSARIERLEAENTLLKAR